MTTHLLALWNPSLGVDSMGAHLALLLRMIREENDDEEHYVWWGKLRSANRYQSLPHLEQILALEEVASAGTDEVHLYLSDFRSLYGVCSWGCCYEWGDVFCGLYSCA